MGGGGIQQRLHDHHIHRISVHRFIYQLSENIKLKNPKYVFPVCIIRMGRKKEPEIML